MFKNKIIKRLLLLVVALLIYTVLTSSIISLRSESKVSDALMESVVGWSQKFHDDREEVIMREKGLSVSDSAFMEKMKGKILLQVESKGEAWYVFPENGKRYYLGRPEHAFVVMNSLAITIEEERLMELLYVEGEFPEEQAGMVVRDKAGEANYYIYPGTKKAHRYTKPKELMQILDATMLGVSNLNIRKIEVADDPL